MAKWTSWALTAAAMTLGGCASLQGGAQQFAQDALAKRTTCREGAGALEDYDAALARAEACRQSYSLAAGAIVTADGAGSLLTGGGGLTALASTGAAAPVTNTYLAGLTLGPVLVRDAANLEPQKALAYQALKAVTQAQCHSASLRLESASLPANLEEERAQGEAALAGIRDRIRERYNAVLAQWKVDKKATETTPLPGVADLATQDATLKQLIAAHDMLQASLSGARDVEARLERTRDSVSEQRLARHLNGELQDISMLWREQAAALAPTPEATLRRVMAAPLSFSARFVSGEEKTTMTGAVASVTYDFSGVRARVGAPAVAMPSALSPAISNVAGTPGDWDALDKTNAAAQRLNERSREVAGALQRIADIDNAAAEGACPYRPAGPGKS